MDGAVREEFYSQVFAVQPRKLLLDAHALRERSCQLYAQSDSIVRRNRARVTQTHRLLETQAQRRAGRLLQNRIFDRLVAGLLPDVDAPVVWGAPGIGGRCDACGDVLQPTQMMMSVPWPRQKTYAHLHADCFMAWKAVRYSVTARKWRGGGSGDAE